MRSRKETQKKMLDYRREHGIKFEDMARQCEMSGNLLYQLEEGKWITHPDIVSRVCAAYHLDVDDFNNFVSKDHRVDVLPKPVPVPKTSKMYV